MKGVSILEEVKFFLSLILIIFSINIVDYYIDIYKLERGAKPSEIIKKYYEI